MGSQAGASRQEDCTREQKQSQSMLIGSGSTVSSTYGQPCEIGPLGCGSGSMKHVDLSDRAKVEAALDPMHLDAFPDPKTPQLD